MNAIKSARKSREVRFHYNLFLHKSNNSVSNPLSHLNCVYSLFGEKCDPNVCGVWQKTFNIKWKCLCNQFLLVLLLCIQFLLRYLISNITIDMMMMIHKVYAPENPNVNDFMEWARYSKRGKPKGGAKFHHYSPTHKPIVVQVFAI